MHAADASAPVGHSSAAAAVQSPLDPAGSSSPQQMPLRTLLAQPSSAIPAMLPKDHDAGDTPQNQVKRSSCVLGCGLLSSLSQHGRDLVVQRPV